jgi:hypothetical protein
MNSVSSWQEALVASWSQVWTSFLTILPTILGAIVVFAIGLLLAYWAKRLVEQLLKAVRLQKLSESSGVDEYLKKADIKLDLADLVALIVEWLIILVFFLAVVDILGLTVVSAVLAQVLAFIPNILAAALIFAAGYLVAGLADGIVRGALASIDHDIAKPIGKVARWLVLLMAFFAAVNQLRIAQNLIATFFQGLTYTVVLVVGLSLGLGAKDLVSEILNDWYKKIKG